MKILVKKAHCSVCVGVLVSYYPQQRDYRANYQQFEIITASSTMRNILLSSCQ